MGPRLAVEANDGPGDGQVVQLGSRVCIRDADGDAEFYVVPPEEVDAVADQASARSPLGGALLGRRVGEVVRFRAPGGALAASDNVPKPAAVLGTGRVWRRRDLGAVDRRVGPVAPDGCRGGGGGGDAG